jgi:hypothetical protein
MSVHSGSLHASSKIRPFASFAKFQLIFIVSIGFLAGTQSALAQTPTPVPVLTWRYDLTHAGQNTQETALTPANVASNAFGKLFSLSVDDHVFAQPLYVPNLKMSDGLVHNVLFVTTENDSIYAFDADAKGNPIWRVSLLTSAYGAGAGATPVPQGDVAPSQDIGPNIGITGTPAINSATNTMYVVANTKESGAYFSRLHAINIVTGAEQAGSPVNITATVAGTGDGSSGGQVPFSPLWTNQRAALNYYNGYVYIAYSSHGDISPYHGWLFAYNASTLQQTAVLCLTPDDLGASVWGSGAGLPIDTSTGKMFVVTANGDRSTPFQSNSDYGQSVLAFNLSNGQLTPADEFTTFNYKTLNTPDWDLGSGGLLMLPDQPGSHPHVIIAAGKEGRVTVLNRDSLGGLAPSGSTSNTNAVQDFTISSIPQGEGFWSTAAYWNGHVYDWAGGDDGGTPNVGMEFQMNNGVMDTTPDTKTTFTSAFPGATFSISSNGTREGIAWAVKVDQFDSNGPAVLYAFDANDLSDIYYESDTKSSDTAGPANKFSVPVVTNGKVYIAAKGEVDVYGLLNAQQTAAAPVIAPDGGTFSSSQSVSMSSATNSAIIYYTLDGSQPTTSSTQYSGAITVSTDTTVNAIATAAGYGQSSVSSATFTFSNQTPPMAFSPAAGTYANAQTVTVSDTDVSAKIYYTTDGTTPSSSSNAYSGPIQVAASETIKAIAIDPALNNSNVGTAAYVIQSGSTTINFATGFSNTQGLTFNGSAAASGSSLQLTNSNTAQAGSVFWNAPINVEAFTTSFEFQISNAQANGFTFTIQNVAPTALGGDSAGLGYQGIQNSVAVKFNFYNYNSEGADSTGLYTNGQLPVTPTVDISPSGIELASGDAIQAQITYDGTTLTLNLLDTVTNDKFSTSWPINIPQTVGSTTAYVGFTAGTGGLASTQSLLNWTYNVVKSSNPTPSFSMSGSAVTVDAPGASATTTVTITPSAGFTGNVSIACAVSGGSGTAPACAVTQPAAITGSQSVSANIAINTQASTGPGSYSMNVTGKSGTMSASTTVDITVEPPVTGPGTGQFALSGSAINIASAGATGTSTITITPSGGFTGPVALACAIATSPSNPVDPPACSVSQPPAVTGTQAVTATLTLSTSPPPSVALHRSLFGLGGGSALAALFLLFVPRRRTWRALLVVFLLGAFLVGASGCAVSKGDVAGEAQSGTTPGEYTVTVTGTSGSVQATTTLDVTIQ